MMSYKSRYPRIIAKIMAEVPIAVQRTGFMIEAGAKRRARVDTGYMRGQIRWTPGKDGLSGEIIGGAYYTIFNEFGTVNMEAQPMFIPAMEEARPFFVGQMELALRRATR